MGTGPGSSGTGTGPGSIGTGPGSFGTGPGSFGAAPGCFGGAGAGRAVVEDDSGAARVAVPRMHSSLRNVRPPPVRLRAREALGATADTLRVCVRIHNLLCILPCVHRLWRQIARALKLRLPLPPFGHRS